MSYTIPSDGHSAGDTGHTGDHNNLSDMAALLTAIGLQLYQLSPALPTGNTNNPANVTALSALLGSATTALLSTQLGTASGVASLDGAGLVPVAQLPVTTQSLFLAGSGAPAGGTGLDGDTYENTATGKVYTRAAGVWTASTTLPGFGLLASSYGFTKIAAAAPTNLLTWTAPNDGANHRVMVFGEENCSVAETSGGTVNLLWTTPGSQAGTQTVFPAAGAINVSSATARMVVVAPNTTVTIQQPSNLVGGTSTVWVELWGS